MSCITRGNEAVPNPCQISTCRPLWLALLVAALAMLAFVPGLPGAFVFDDIPNIVNNDSIHLPQLSLDALYQVITTPQPSGSMRGLPTLSFALDYWRAGGVADPATFKLTNIFIHGLTAFCLVWLLRSVLQSAGMDRARVAWLAPLLALMWALHPLQVSSVLYAVQRLQTMGTLFLVIALLAYLHGRQAQIAGASGRNGLLLSLLAWAFALGCKEDSVLLPAYALALELTVLRFAADDARVARLWRSAYLVAVLCGLLFYALWAVPHYWSWEPHEARGFTTLERLLTQPRVLCMYLWQIVVPLPGNMPFYYDWLEPSRGLLTPWTTLPALLTVVLLLALAWVARRRQPLFALGVFLFFAAHFITSNVVALELAFEHRNHFALIGAVLAVAALFDRVGSHLPRSAARRALVCLAIVGMLAGGTVLRAQAWSSAIGIREAATRAAPGSARAWVELCDAYFKEGGGVRPGNPRLDEAIAACAAGTANAPGSLNSPALLLALKTLRGDVTRQDWDLFQQRLRLVHMSWDNIRAPQILIHYARQGVALDKAQVLDALATLNDRASMRPGTLAFIGDFIMNDLGEPERAMPYLTKVVQAIPPTDPFTLQLLADLRSMGKPELAEAIEKSALQPALPGSPGGSEQAD